jgi:predicted transcriptional regulator
LSTQQLQSLNARVDQLKLQLDERTSETIQLKAEKEIQAKSSSEQLNLIQCEVTGLRDQVLDLQNQNQQLMMDVKRHQERALLTLVQPDEEKKEQVDREVT